MSHPTAICYCGSTMIVTKLTNSEIDLKCPKNCCTITQTLSQYPIHLRKPKENKMNIERLEKELATLRADLRLATARVDETTKENNQLLATNGQLCDTVSRLVEENAALREENKAFAINLSQRMTRPTALRDYQKHSVIDGRVVWNRLHLNQWKKDPIAVRLDKIGKHIDNAEFTSQQAQSLKDAFKHVELMIRSTITQTKGE